MTVETFYNMLVDRAIGGVGNDYEYRELRHSLLAEPQLKGKLPRFVQTCRNLGEFWAFIKLKFSTYHERANYLKDQFEPVLTYLEDRSDSPVDEAAEAVLSVVGSAYIREAWQKALERRTIDPEGAVTSSRALLETVCKHVLDEMNLEYDDKADLPKLYGLVADHLNLAPSQHTEKVFKQILGGCQTVVEGLGAVRNKLSDAHGKGKSAPRPAPRHAELAVNLAGTMATFLLATWEARKAVDETS